MSQDSVGFTHIAGQVRNDGNAPVKYLELIVTLHNAGGTVVDMDTTFAKLDTIAPGQVSPYEFISQPPAFSRYTLLVQASH